MGLAVLSHWLLDFLVHRPDLPLYDDAAKVGLGLWNRPALAFALEAGLLAVGVGICARRTSRLRLRLVLLGLAMLGMQGLAALGPPPPSAAAATATSLVAYAILAAAAWLLVDRGALRGAAV